LGQIVAIRVVFATLKDAVFVVMQDEEWCRSVNGKEQHQIELAITRPAIRVPAIESSAANATDSYRVIFPYRQVGESYALIPEEELRTAYPQAYAYLTAHKEALLQRDKQRKFYSGWYAWGRTQGMSAPGPKLLTKTFSRSPNFVFDPTDALYCNGYGLFPRRETTISLAALMRILNSRVMDYYARLTSFQIRGDYQCYQKNFIERFGIPAVPPTEVDTLLALTPSEVDEYLAALYGIAWVDLTEITG
jgi:hypothetical protein